MKILGLPNDNHHTFLVAMEPREMICIVESLGLYKTPPHELKEIDSEKFTKLCSRNAVANRVKARLERALVDIIAWIQMGPDKRRQQHEDNEV